MLAIIPPFHRSDHDSGHIFFAAAFPLEQCTGLAYDEAEQQDGEGNDPGSEFRRFQAVARGREAARGAARLHRRADTAVHRLSLQLKLQLLGSGAFPPLSDQQRRRSVCAEHLSGPHARDRARGARLVRRTDAYRTGRLLGLCDQRGNRGQYLRAFSGEGTAPRRDRLLRRGHSLQRCEEPARAEHEAHHDQNLILFKKGLLIFLFLLYL